jgi:hypothetical protein
VRTLSLGSKVGAHVQTAWPSIFAGTLRIAGPYITELELDFAGASASCAVQPEVLSRTLRALHHCQALKTLSLKGEPCLQALAAASRAAPTPQLASLETLKVTFRGHLPPCVFASWPRLRHLSITVLRLEPHPPNWPRRRPETVRLRLPDEIAVLRELRTLSVRFADRCLAEHPGLLNHLEAAAGMSALGNLEALHLRHCALSGSHWAGVWPGLTSLTDLRFHSCLGSSLSRQVGAALFTGKVTCILQSPTFIWHGSPFQERSNLSVSATPLHLEHLPPLALSPG